MGTDGFREIADRVWVWRQDWLDLNVTLIAGAEGLALVDTTGSAETGRELRDAVRRLSAAPLLAVINTHAHFDHTFGNAAFSNTAFSNTAFSNTAIPIHAHEAAAAATVSSGQLSQQEYAAGDDPHRDAVVATEIVPADQTFSSAWAIDLGDRILELVHPGKGHTDGDLVVRIPDVDVLIAGDLVEESAPPVWGPDCHPLDWPATLDLVGSLLTPGSTVVPGHGAVADTAFVSDQRDLVGTVAETIRDLAGRGVRAEDALGATQWPVSVDLLQDAVRRGYAHLPRESKRLPLA